MEMRILAEMSQWLLTETELRDRWGASTWRTVFDACGSPREWSEFTRSRQEDRVLLDVRVQYERIAKEVLKTKAPRRRSQIALPEF